MKEYNHDDLILLTLISKINIFVKIFISEKSLPQQVDSLA